MSLRKWLEKRPTIILKEPLIKKLTGGASPTEALSYELGELVDDLWYRGIVPKNVEETRNMARYVNRWFGYLELTFKTMLKKTIDFGPQRKILDELVKAAEAGDWEKARKLHDELSLEISEVLMGA